MIGGGTFYGKGGIAIIDLTTGDSEVFSCSDLVPRRSERDWVPTIASLCLSDGDRYLAAATRSARFQPGPACLFELTGSRLALRQRFEYGHAAFGLTPTGVLLATTPGKTVLSREHEAALRAILSPEWNRLLTVFMGTGLRRGEL